MIISKFKAFLLILLGMILSLMTGVAQGLDTTENFDGSVVTFTSNPTGGWIVDTSYYVSSPNAYWAAVPNLNGQTVVLESPVYDLTNYSNVVLRFKHICKLSRMDSAIIEYKISGQGWQRVPKTCHGTLGGLSQASAVYQTQWCFNANSYPTDWVVSDSLAMPTQSWWKSEVFDVSHEVGHDNNVQFRFILKKGNVMGTQIAYGWLLDDIEIQASTVSIIPPSVNFIAPYPQGTVYAAGPYIIATRAATNTTAPLRTPTLIYTQTLNGVTTVGSVAMTFKSGTTWEAIIPAFALGSHVTYIAIAQDTAGNTNSATADYTIVWNPANPLNSNAAALEGFTLPILRQINGGVATPVQVILRNKGTTPLTSATINWTVNSVSQTPYNWSDSLYWDITDTVTVGNFIPSLTAFDTIVVWVSAPNGATESNHDDDTLKLVTYGCGTPLINNYTVGAGGNFADFNEFLLTLTNCEPAGNITLSFLPGTHNYGINLTNLNDLINGYSLTLTSSTGNADDDTLLLSSGNGITLNNCNNIIIKDLTIQNTGTTNSYGINFTGACSNVVIRNCKFLLSSTVTAATVNNIYKAANTGVCSNIYFIGNQFNGGYNGISFEGGISATPGSNIVFDSNTVTNTYYSGAIFTYCNLNSVSFNTIVSRNADQGTVWTGLDLNFSYGNNIIVNNRIHQFNESIVNPRGISINTLGQAGNPLIALLANNEILLHSGALTGYAGIDIAASRAKVLFNSIYIGGTAGKGIQIASNSLDLEIKHNNIVLSGVNAYPLFAIDSYNSSLWKVDFNNLYAPNFVGYITSPLTSLNTLQQTTQGKSSFSLMPQFVDTTENLQLSDFAGLTTAQRAEVSNDILNTPRTAITSVGCYHGTSAVLLSDLLIEQVVGYQQYPQNGQTDTIKALIINNGTDTIFSATLQWEINGNPQTAPAPWSGALPPSGQQIITLGTITYSGTVFSIKVYIANIGTQTDVYKNNDTMEVRGYISPNPLSGTYLVGSGGHFADIYSALEILDSNGAGGDVCLSLLPSTYVQPIDLTNVSNVMNGHKLTITSALNNASSVVIRHCCNGFILNNSNNVVISALTIDVATGTNWTYGILFSGSCTNVVIRDCRIEAINRLTSLFTSSCIKKATGTGVVDSIFIINNTLINGSPAVDFYGGTDVNNMGHNIVFDSNTVKISDLGYTDNDDYTPIRMVFCDIKSLSYNYVEVLSKMDWFGIYIYNSNADSIIGNRFYHKSTAATYPAYCYALYLSNVNKTNTTKKAVIANNDIHINYFYNYENMYGIYVANANAKILHNSIYIDAPKAYCIYVTSAASELEIKYNNLISIKSGTYAIYLAAITNLGLMDIDHNNMYATNVGYATTARTSIAAWQSIVTSDKHSFSVLPPFINADNSSQLSDYSAFMTAPRLVQTRSEVPYDKLRQSRMDVTTVGCYHGSLSVSVEAMLLNVEGFRDGNIAGQNDTLKVLLYNGGVTSLDTVVLRWEINGVLQPTPIKWTGNLPTGGATLVPLGVFNYVAGNMNFKVYIENLGDMSDIDISNDTIVGSTYICDSAFSGTYTIGASGDFSTFAEAFNVIKTCGVSNHVTFAFQAGTYTEPIDLTNIDSYMNGYTFTLTSVSGNAIGTSIQQTTGGIVTFRNSNNLIIKGLTFDLSSVTAANSYGMNFLSACSNIVIRDCRILCHPTSTVTTLSAIYKGNTLTMDSVSIINNVFDGGAYGLQISAGSATTTGITGKNIVIDSNTFTNQYSYGVSFSAAYFKSFSNNTILGRTGTSYASWGGLYFSYCLGEILSNHVQQRNTTATTPVGIYISYHNFNAADNPSQTRYLVANNEIILYATNASAYGINIWQGSRVKVWHNSVYVGGTNGSGIFVNNISHSDVRYNNVYMAGADAYPLNYSNSMPFFTSYNQICDYNNMYAPVYVGFALLAHKSIEQWQSVVTTDHNSFRILPSYINTAVDLRLNYYSGFLCPTSSEVPTDISGTSRGAWTNVGCWHDFPNYNTDANLAKLMGVSSSKFVGQKDTLKVIIFNSGTTILDSIHLSYTFNGVQTTKLWTGSLQPWAVDTFLVGIITYTSEGDNEIKVFIDDLGDMTDNNLINDTVTVSNYSCLQSLNGTYVIGTNGGYYPTLSDALRALTICGAGNDVVFAIQSGTYTGSIDLTSFSDNMNGHYLTLTSQAGDADSVVLQITAAGTVITLSNSNNLIIKNLTIKTTPTTGTLYGIRFAYACTNVLIRDCKIISSSTATASIYGIDKASSTGTCSNVSFINNLIDGGYYGIRFYGGASSSTYGAYIVFDSNIVTNQYYYGTYFYYTSFSSVRKNTVLSRASSATASWYGFYFYSCNGDILCNHVRQRSTTITNPQGMYIYYHNYRNATGLALIANNEIMVRTTSASYYGLYLSYSTGMVLYNSIYVDGTAGSGIRIANNSRPLEVKYNNIVMVGTTTAYPIYLEGISYLSQWNIDYNNMYGSTNVGYASGAKTSIAAWQATVTTDKNSIRQMPTFEDYPTSLKLATNSANDVFLCPLARAELNFDIDGSQRYTFTYMGAYSMPLQQFDLTVADIVEKQAVMNQTFTVNALVQNLGLDTVYNAILSWSKNNLTQGSVSWSATPDLTSVQTAQIPMGSFVFDGNPASIKVWLDSVNHQNDDFQLNDTLTATIMPAPLAWFVAPLIADTILNREFDVYAVIMSGSGALSVEPNPKLCLESWIGATTIYDTIAMTFTNGIWSAHIPQQYYGSKVIYSLSVSDTVGNSITIKDSTYIKFNSGYAPYLSKNLTVAKLNGLDVGSANCLPAFSTLDLEIINTGNQAFDFSEDTLSVHLELLTPIALSIDTLVSVNAVSSRETMHIILTDSFPLYVAGKYEFKISISINGDNIVYDDTLLYSYVSGRFGLPIDEDFSNNTMNMVFNSVAEVGNATWYVIPQGTGNDAKVTPDFGDGILAFNGTAGSVSRLYTKQLDLSQTVQPNLSFWYFEDTIPCLDYMDVRVTIDGGATYTTLFSLKKYNPWYSGWRQYSVDLPTFAVNQCVFIVFEAMEKDRSGQTWQYIDRIRMMARQDIEVANVILPDISACDMQTKDIKVVLSNLTDPVLDYASTLDSFRVTLQILETNETFTVTKSSGVLGSFGSDTFTVVSNYNFVPGTYTLKAYFTSVFDYVPANDTLQTGLNINPHLHVTAPKNSAAGNCLTKNFLIQQDVIVANNGNVKVEDFVLTVEVHGNSGILQTLIDTVRATLLPDSVLNYSFTKDYTVPAEDFYNVLVYAKMLNCPASYSDSAVITECVDLTDIEITSLLEPSLPADTMGTQATIKVRLTNNDANDFNGNLILHAIVNDGNTNTYNQTANIVHYFNGNEYYDYEFTTSYMVPVVNDYTITVYFESVDKYKSNDTLRVSRQTVAIPDVADLSVTTLLSPSSAADTIGNQCFIKARISNNDTADFNDALTIHAVVNDGVTEIYNQSATITHYFSGNDYYDYEFTTPYTVPLVGSYTICVYIDSADKFNYNDTLCTIRTTIDVTDTTDLQITALLSPSGAVDTVGVDYTIKVRITNDGDETAYNVLVYTDLTQQGTTFYSETVTIDSIAANAYFDAEFALPYAVPDEGAYSIHIYLENVDIYPNNDTLLVNRTAVKKQEPNNTSTFDSESITLSQNIPNPASNTTKVEYSLPHDGKATFSIYTTAGQVIYTQSVDATVGKNNIIFDLNGLSSGIYFYSMEFEGQKLVRKMSVK